MKTLRLSFLFVVASFVSTSAVHAALQNGKVQVAITKGESTLINPKLAKEVATTGKLFEQGYKVETNKDATTELVLSNGSTLLLNANTLIEVRTFRQVPSELILNGDFQKLEKEPSPSVVEIYVVRGKVIGEVRKLNPQSSFTIKTPVGVARIRGTVYSVEITKDKVNGLTNMEVACVKGSVEVTAAGSNNGSSMVNPGTKIIISVAGGEPVDMLKQNKPRGNNIAAPANNTNTVALYSTEGLNVGDKITGPGIPDGTTVLSIDTVKHEVKLSQSVTIDVGASLTVLVNDKPTDTKNNQMNLSAAAANQNVIALFNTKDINVGDIITGPGREIPDGTTVVSIDTERHEVTLSNPITLEAGAPVFTLRDMPETTPLAPPVVIVSRLEPAEISTVSNNLASGTSLPVELTKEIQTIADKTPLVPPTASENKTTTQPTASNGGDSGIGNVMDSISKVIEQTIEKQNQVNPSPTQ